jgi:hypothetical protein
MEVTSAYLTSSKNFSDFMSALQKAAVPARFTHEFLQLLGFKNTSERAFISLLKGLGLIDQNSVPTQAYKDYRNAAIAKQVLARQIKLAYPGLFNADEHAERMDDENLKGRLSTLTGKDVSVVQKMATTFKMLCGLADFSTAPPIGEIRPQDDDKVESPAMNAGTPPPQGLRFSHTIYINLPAVTDVAVYDAIFKSLRENLT